MKTIIIHVGPPKCGSSTIQHEMNQLSGTRSWLGRSTKKLFRSRSPIDFHLLNPKKISELDVDFPSDDTISYFEKILKKSRSEVCILSHEVLFQRPAAVAHLAELAASQGHDTRIVGYSRRQDDFLRSSFCQWIFRDRGRLQESWDALSAENLDPIFFSALERHLISAVITDFETARMLRGDHILNWHDRYRILEEATSPFGTSLSVGHLPSSSHPFSLMEDALARCEVHRSPSPRNPPTNEQFNLDLVEAIASACLAGHSTPEPHKENGMLVRMSRSMPERKLDKSDFMAQLNAYILATFWDDNRAFCKRFSLDASYFAPRFQVDRTMAMERIREENDRRWALPFELLEARGRLVSTLANLTVQQARRL